MNNPQTTTLPLKLSEVLKVSKTIDGLNYKVAHLKVLQDEITIGRIELREQFDQIKTTYEQAQEQFNKATNYEILFFETKDPFKGLKSSLKILDVILNPWLYIFKVEQHVPSATLAGLIADDYSPQKYNNLLEAYQQLCKGTIKARLHLKA